MLDTAVSEHVDYRNQSAAKKLMMYAKFAQLPMLNFVYT